MVEAQANNCPQRQPQTDTVVPDSSLVLMNDHNIRACTVDSKLTLQKLAIN